MPTLRRYIGDDAEDDDETYGFSKLLTMSSDNLCDQLEQNISHLAAVQQQQTPKKTRKLSSTFLANRMKLVSQRTQKLFQRIYPSSSVDRQRRPEISNPILLDDHHYPPEWNLKPVGRSRRSLSYGNLHEPSDVEPIEITKPKSINQERVLDAVDDADSGILVNESGQSSIVCESATPDDSLTQEEPILKFIQLQMADSSGDDRNLGITVEQSRHSWVGFEITQIAPNGLVARNGTICVGDELISLMGEPVRSLTSLEMQEKLKSCASDLNITFLEITIARRTSFVGQNLATGIRRHISFAEDSSIGALR